jgi:hypothetical protein
VGSVIGGRGGWGGVVLAATALANAPANAVENAPENGAENAVDDVRADGT